ncbi:MAG: 3-phosphoserine/phosphohydroxythreonine transaminase [Leptospiraceae bacterium]|nr:3-phosphoserine/phosphohydroxythreonine transaminase [Leptospiraceae bacterium]MCK6382426.1 3-phosphoserine/phosphohydroxythreonine transaminase [Leptospiraceae bacterium]NUM40851.1 3-phosphoserine/phosphohydroxythreonine transaminase [Leptospiraceae bacterium]
MSTIKNKTFNFNAGPAMLPIEVMEKAKEEFLDYQGTGMSVMEMSHRGTHFHEIIESAESNLRRLLNISENYSVIFYPGGATLQFSAVPLNLLNENESGDYAITGVWTKKAFQEAKKFFPVKSIYDGEIDKYSSTPILHESQISKQAKYVFITSNNTIYGTRYKSLPVFKNTPLVADMTSEILSRKLNIENFGLIFAGAQKNIGPSGLTIVIIRNDLLEYKKKEVPILLDYKVMAKNKSLYNTPPTFAIYMARLVFDWCIKMGGVEKLEEINQKKSSILYEYIDSSKLYKAPVQKESRSEMNVVFHIKEKDLEKSFADESDKNGLHGLSGHRDAGGFRASIYNAMPVEGVLKLIDFMKDFEDKHVV